MASELPWRFNVRAYGIWLREEAVLLTRERPTPELELLKFPGGGVEFREGVEAALRREWHEETGLSIDHLSHYYTTGFYQASKFRANEQVISIYYAVQCRGEPRAMEPGVSLEWHSLAALDPNRISLPIDQHVANLLLKSLFRS